MNEEEVPVIELPREGRIIIRTPPDPDIRRWFFDKLGWRVSLGPDPDGLGGVTLPRGQLDRVTDLLVDRWGGVDLLREYQPLLRCVHRCRYATKLLCACPCSGEQHGSQAVEVPLLGPVGSFELVDSGLDNWSLVRITHQAR
jgi:hypothetical protein